MGKTYESSPAEGARSTGAAHPVTASETAGLLPTKVTASVLGLREAVSAAGGSAREAVHVLPAASAHPAEAAHAHHLVRNGVDLLPVDDYRAAGEGDAAVNVEGGAAGDVDGSAGNDEVAVGIRFRR